ncbi:endoglucanase E-4-like [Schistocerca cancellata]|uniref:endoglucanase E-4-like n=1 Tax=Schistocerca cancellata TaxID=274614 RepID=UPI00211968EB|nr:endoglucanase E-4-like [Schistocerca cancellata]
MARYGVFFLLGILASSQAYDYKDALQKSLLFYQAQRSGKLSGMDSSLYWRGDSALNDKGQNGEDLTGGYYDAGDHVKFGFPMAFAMTTLAWGILDWGDGYTSAGVMDEARNCIRWGMDYLIKAHISDNELYVQVGDGTADHNYWGRPEDMTMDRPSYKITTSAPGSDVAAETAAAFAAASLVFKGVDDNYANTLLSHAKALFDFADNYRGVYSNSVPAAASFYGSNGYADELPWGAVWLYRATASESYLNRAIELYNEGGLQYRSGYGWDEKSSGATVMIARFTSDQTYKTTVQNYCDNLMNNQQRTPKGLIFLGEWGSLRNMAGAMFICMMASDRGINPSAYRSMVKEQMGYALGDTGFSYVCGIDSNYPRSPHHRSSSCPDAPATCDWNTFNGAQANAHVLNGALVGGPGANDDYVDTRQDAQKNEVALDYNAPFQGLLAALIKYNL